MVLHVQLDVRQVRVLGHDEHEVRYLDEEEVEVEKEGFSGCAEAVGGVGRDVLEGVAVVRGEVGVVVTKIRADHGVHVALHAPETLLCEERRWDAFPSRV